MGLRVPLTSLGCERVRIALLLSSKKSCKRGNNEVNALGDRLGEVRVGAQLLAEADKDEGLNQTVEVSSHRLALLGQENPVSPLARLPAGVVVDQSMEASTSFIRCLMYLMPWSVRPQARLRIRSMP